MGLIGKEIVQARTYIDPSAPPPPNLNYKYEYPKTVLRAVMASLEDADKEDAVNLENIIDDIYKEIKNKQPIFPSKPANNIMTFAGEAGAVGSIPISMKIPWDPASQSHSKIPTEKAVGDLMLKLGLVDENGNPIDPDKSKVRWSDVIGRPLLYEGLGNNDDGFITQKGTTIAINNLGIKLNDVSDELLNKINSNLEVITKHISDSNNPHHINISDIGAASADLFNEHINSINPHNILPETIGLGNVNNTSDLDKPISNATQEALDILNKILNNLSDEVNGLDFIVNADYDQKSGKLSMELRHGDMIIMSIPIDDLVDEIEYDNESKELVFKELNGDINRVSLADLYIRYVGSVSDSITVEIVGKNDTGKQIIKAYLNPGGINGISLADGSVTTRILADGSVTNEKITDLTITTIKYADESITTEKISRNAITNTRIADRSVDGRTLFTSSKDNRILGVLSNGSNPIWTQVISGMIADNAILTQHISNESISTEKLANNSITTSKIANLAINTEKIIDGSITHEKLSNNSVDGSNIVEDVILRGIPLLKDTPSEDANNHEIVDANWVYKILDKNINKNKNLGDRSVDGRVLFTSELRHRVLAVLRAGSDPVWSLIDNDMIAENSISTKNIQNYAITSDKIDEKAILSKHLNNDSISEYNIQESAVTSEKIYKSHTANTVLGVLNEDGHPEYVKINGDMIENNAIGTKQIQDGSVSPSKLKSSDISYRVLGVMLKGSNPEWMQVSNNMIANRAIDGRTLFTSSTKDMILAVTSDNGNPSWIKIYSELLGERIITKDHIKKESICEEHLQENIIGSNHIKDRSIQTKHIESQAITGEELFRSPLNNKILATVNGPYSKPIWTELSGSMLEDKSISREKLFQSNHSYRVLGVTQPGVPPEYLMITSNFIVDGSILPSKLSHNFVLYGTPELTLQPKKDANNNQLANTKWVRETVADMINDFYPDLLYDSIKTNMIEDHAVTGLKLFTSPYDGPRVLGVTAKGEEAEYLLVEEEMIADGSVTENKLARNIHLLGSPKVEIRPSPHANDSNGEGTLIPDCQWVLDRIKEASLSGGGSGSTDLSSDLISVNNYETNQMWNENVMPSGEYFTGEGTNLEQISNTELDSMWNKNIIPSSDNVVEGINLSEITKSETNAMWYEDIIPSDPIDTPSGGNSSGNGEIADGSVTSDKLQNRSVLASKLFTSEIGYRVLAVLESNTDPQYTQIINPMIANRAIDGRTLFTSKVSNRILGVTTPLSDPDWIKINHEMLEDNIIGTDQIIDLSIVGSKIANGSITKEKLATNQSMIDSILLEDNSVITQKIADNAVEREKIRDHSINTKKLDSDLILKGKTIVDDSDDYEARSLRNTIITPNIPTNTSNGDIIFLYV